MAQPKMRLMSATTDNLTGRTLCGFSDGGSNMLTVNAALSLSGKDVAKATRSALVDVLREAADALEAVDKEAAAS